MDGFYQYTSDVAILRHRLEELARIRQGYAAHLGSSLYEATKGMEELRWGRESLYDGIAACDAEREEILARIASVSEAEVVEATLPEPAAVTMVVPTPMPASEPEEEPAPEAFEPALNPYELADEDGLGDEDEYAAEDEGFADDEDEAADSGLFVVPDVYEEDVEDNPLADDVPLADDARADEAQDAHTCHNCGSPVDEGDKFCMTCGMALVAVPDAFDAEPAYRQGEPGYPPRPEEFLEQAPTCAVCGTVGGPGNRFCMVCGSPLTAAPEPAPAPQAGACPVCGSPTDPSFKFCMTCGHKLI